MDVSEAVRRAHFAALTPLIVEGVTIPVFDEVVNPDEIIPTLNGASVYVIIQDQQEVEGIQNFCGYRQNCSITHRVVSKFATNKSIGKKVAEKLSDIIQSKIKPTGKTHSLVNANGYTFQSVNKELSRTIFEEANGTTAISKVIIYNNIVNQ
ncbi:hypothetical protein [Sphingobacterium lactis]|uniref:Uncharacterized protein n=1 Tax=Sphingobacterium lactis TaxID=797291 RepID=A0A1H6CSS4_9SPHI|nr:hypothetical protein [Sphingobacterium lactis]SEG75827.1 hypothetical protein SAMN05421877_11948 [Sphingobacterium lactis]